MNYPKLPEKYTRIAIEKQVAELKTMKITERERLEIKEYFGITSDIAFNNYINGKIKNLFLCTAFILKCREVISKRKYTT